MISCFHFRTSNTYLISFIMRLKRIAFVTFFFFSRVAHFRIISQFICSWKLGNSITFILLSSSLASPLVPSCLKNISNTVLKNTTVEPNLRKKIKRNFLRNFQNFRVLNRERALWKGCKLIYCNPIPRWQKEKIRPI